jgi:hypothetical protein
LAISIKQKPLVCLRSLQDLPIDQQLRSHFLVSLGVQEALKKITANVTIKWPITTLCHTVKDRRNLLKTTFKKKTRRMASIIGIDPM